jgi:riboflavin synthase alpha subunit
LYGSTKVAIEQAMDETKQQEGTLLTGHRYLVSKVIERRPEDFAYILQGIVNMVPKALDELYPILEKIG